MSQKTISYGRSSLMRNIVSMVAFGTWFGKLGHRAGVALVLLLPLSATGAVDSDRPPSIQANPTGLPQIINGKIPVRKFHPSHVLVRFRPDTPKLMRDTAHQAAQAQRVLKRYRFVSDLRLVEVPTGSVVDAVAAYRANPHVLYAEPDYTIELSELPDDPFFDLLWGMSNTGQAGDGPFCFPEAIPGFDVRAAGAWDLWTGDPNFRIAVIDTGIDYLHPDLAQNVWTNPLEAPGDANGDGCPGVCGVDDDGDGLIDEDSLGRQPSDPGYSNDLVDDDDENSWPNDIHGYDMFNGDGDPMDDNGHGSHVSGTIGAVGNNGIGVAGLNWQCKIVALKMFGADGTGANVSEAIAAMEYVIAGGIRVSNNSWGFANGFSQALYDVIAAAQAVGHIFVTAAGNNFGLNIDSFPRYPAAYDLENIIAVAAMDNHGTLAAFSNIGPVSVDLAAPGSCIYSTVSEQGYGYKNGTSMATPHVTGTVALLTSLRPELDWMQVRAGILSTVRPLEAFEGVTATGGSLDVRSALGDCNGNGLFDTEDIGNGTSLDCTGNGIPDECERDCDKNGVADTCDVLVDPSLDCDGDGVLNSCEVDCNDNDISDDCEILDGSARDCNDNGKLDICEIPSHSTAPGGPFFCTANCVADCNENGQPDSCDIDDGLSFDCTNNGVPDECEEDCNDNAAADSCDILNGLSVDCTRDGVPDECEPDCNLNLLADSCDIADGSSADCTANAVPDECEPDCNLNGVADSCDIDSELSRDCDGNGVPDECQIIDIPDCNGNGVLDSCDLLDGTSPDCNSNLMPDECDVRDGVSLDDNQNAVPDECDGKGVALVPVDATGPHVIKGNEIFLETGGQRVTFDIRISGWDLNLDGDPRLLAYQLQIGAAGFSSGLFGELSLAKLPCTSDSDCFGANVCEEEEQPGAERFCNIRASAYIDPTRSDYVFFNLISFRVTNPVFVAPDFWLVGALFLVTDSVADDGTDKYAGTVVLDVPIRAGGTFTVGFTPRGTLFRKGFGQAITVPSMSPARITIPPDCNGNGVVDNEELANGSATDCNGNGVLDECIEFESDCNANGRPDACDIAAGVSTDCNGNGVPDECLELETDCNDNAIPDACDIDNQVSSDCNENTRPDECDIATDRSNDCNENGIPDECASLETDCNQNGVPDDCDFNDGTSSDCNTNEVPDECDITAGTSLDENGNGVPDECQRTLRVPGVYATIQEAIDASHDGDAVLVADGIYRGEGNVALNFWGRKIEVCSENGPIGCIIDCENEERGIVFTNHETRMSRFSGFTITGGLENFGGAMLFRRSSPMIANCRLVGNRAESMGGAVMCDQTSDPLITRCIVADNTTAGVGAGFAIDGASDPDIRNCLIVRNIAGDNGGAFYVDNLSQPVINNCTITLNEARRGGGIYSARRLIFSPTLTAPIVRNSILWGDRVIESGREIFLEQTAELIVGYSLIDQGLPGTVESSANTLVWEEGNTSDYPRFVDPLGGDFDQLTWQDNDYRLRSNSPAVGAGSPDFVPFPAETDLESHPRVLCERIDQGAYELGIGDFDCDMSLTLLDFAFWPSCHDGPSSLSKNQACRSFDFDGDRDIDLEDYGALQRHYGN